MCILLLLLFLRQLSCKALLLYLYLFFKSLQIIWNGRNRLNLIFIDFSFSLPFLYMRMINFPISIWYYLFFLLFVQFVHLFFLSYFVKSLGINMPYASLDGDLVNPRQKISLVNIRMLIWDLIIILKVWILDSPLAIIEKASYFLHINYAVNLTCGKFTQPIFAALSDYLLIHFTLFPIVRNILFLKFFL